MPSIPELHEEFRNHVKAGRAIFDRADSQGRELTAAEQSEAQRHLDAGKEAKSRAEQTGQDNKIKAAIADLGLSIGVNAPGGAVTSPRVKAAGGNGGWSTAVLQANSDRAGQFKALLPGGAVPVTIPLRPEPVRLGEPVLAMRQLIPTQADLTGRWSYLKQTVRTSNAAPVAPGAKKPTSIFSLSRVEERCRTIAHLSEPLQRQDLDDAPTLRQFVDDELRLGLEVALEGEIVNGDGTGERFMGLGNVSGAQVQAFTTNLFITTRKAITKLEVLSISGTGWLFAPADWEKLELLTDNNATYMLGGGGQTLPVDRAARRLWGIPVVVSTAVTAGSGFLVDFAGSTELRIREDARVDWSENLYDPNKFGTGIGGSNYEANQITFRCEGRFGFGITRPAGVVELTLA